MSHGGHHHGSHSHGHEKRGHKFNPAMLDRLRDPGRLRWMNPGGVWAVLTLWNFRPIGTLVDLGAGLGFFAIPFARRMPYGQVYACDSSPEMLEHLKAELAEHRAANVIPVLTEEVRIPLPNNMNWTTRCRPWPSAAAS
jgi:predicted O-methyltransferase YrrM